MAFKDYIASGESRVALLVTEAEQHALHTLAELGVGPAVNLEEEVEKAVATAVSSAVALINTELGALSDDIAKLRAQLAEVEAKAASPAAAPTPEAAPTA